MWLDGHTSTAADWHADALQAAKQETVAVVLPALNEAATVGEIVTTIHEELHGGLVDDLVVLDSGSTDDTAQVAADHGARVVRLDEVFPSLPVMRGKGEAMWRALAATDADLVVFVDADLRSFTASYITGLLGPLLTDPGIQLVKAVYERPLVEGDSVVPAGGGRVTELVARPLLNLYWPQLAGIIQPLAGEYAARRSLLSRLPFPVGYGVEFALLVDTAEMFGVDAIAQVDLGVRLHRHHDERRLGLMAAQIMQTALRRLDPQMHASRSVGQALAQFDRVGHDFVGTWHAIVDVERPPLATAPIAQWA
ncbi:MAG: glucosyl-3-phosphoglycerate synthase [Micrococcales bacterium]|nr:glucosyl-3-phosphoglycerate synthase [Micrococcales bacterium]